MMNKKLILCLLLIPISLLILPISSFAQTTIPEERITVITYYPAPFGVYNELRSKRMAIGNTYYDPAGFCFDDGTGNCDPALQIEIPQGTDLVIEGNVGIGTVDPKEQLSVHSGTTQGQIHISGVSDGGLTYSAVYLHDNTADNWNNWVLTHKNGTGDVMENDFWLSYWNAAGVLETPFAIDHESGNIGIGTTVPSYNLDVAGEINGSDGGSRVGLLAHPNYPSLFIVSYSNEPSHTTDSGNGGHPEIHTYDIGGTVTSPSNTKKNNPILSLVGSGYYSPTQAVQAARLQFVTEDNFSSSHAKTAIVFYPGNKVITMGDGKGSYLEALRITSQGAVTYKPRNTAPLASGSAAPGLEGSLYYNNGTGSESEGFKYHDGDNWKDFGGSSTGCDETCSYYRSGSDSLPCVKKDESNCSKLGYTGGWNTKPIEGYQSCGRVITVNTGPSTDQQHYSYVCGTTGWVLTGYGETHY